MDSFDQVQTAIQNVMMIILLAAGIIMTLGGLLLWLFGLRSLRVIAGLSLAAIVFYYMRLRSPGSLHLQILLTVIAAVAGFAFKKKAGALRGIAASGLIGILFVTAPTLAGEEFWKMPEMYRQSTQGTDVLAMFNYVMTYIGVMAGRFRDLAVHPPAGAAAAGLVCIIAAALAAFFRPLWVAAVFTSFLGTMQFAIGAALIMLYKEMKPFSWPRSHPQTAAAAAAAIILVGVLIQSALFPERKKIKPPDLEKELASADRSPLNRKSHQA